jgi:hypothetical protein
MSMSRCSSTVFIVRGRVGFVEEGMTLGREHTVIMSGAWPPVKGVGVGVGVSVDLVSCVSDSWNAGGSHGCSGRRRVS